MFAIERYNKAQSVEDAVKLLVADSEAKLIAGGTDVLIRLHEGSSDFRSLVDINGLAVLKEITEEPDGTVRIGSLATFSEIMDSDVVNKRVPVIAEAAATVGGPQLRNTATMGGNICAGVPCADSAGALLVLFIVVQLIVRPLFARNDRLQKQLRARTLALSELQKMRTEYENLQAATLSSSARFDQREKDFTLYKFLNRLAGETGIKENIKSMKPTTTEQKDSRYKISRVDMRLESITPAQLTDYLHRVETSANMVSIKKMSVTKKEDNEGLLTAILQVETLET